MNRAVIVRMGGEIGIKSKRIRNLYEKKVVNNIVEVLKRNSVEFSYMLKYPGRAYVFTEESEKAAELISRIFGVASTSACFVADSNIEKMIGEILEIALMKLKPGTFAVRCRRVGNHPYKSKDVEELLGRAILESRGDLRVNLGNPDQVVHIEIRDENAYVYFESFRGPDGFPLSTQDPVIGIINETKESVIASWCVMRRGAEIKALVCGGLSENVKSNIKRLLEWIPDGEIEVYKVDAKHRSKALEILTAMKLAEMEKINGVVSGIRNIDVESLKRLSRLNASIFFPLIALDDEIVRDLCRYIGLGEYIADEELVRIEDLKLEGITYEIIKLSCS